MITASAEISGTEIIGAETPPPKMLDKYRFALNSINQITPLLLAAGIPKDVLGYALAQLAYETNLFKSHVSKEDLNLSGIKFINKPYQHATRGIKSPEGDYYAKFGSYQDWANDYARILKLGGANAPINATSLNDFVDRLHSNHYFTADPAIYKRGLQTIYSAVPGLQHEQNVQTSNAQKDIVAAERSNSLIDSWNDLSGIKKLGLIGTGTVLLIFALTRKK